MIENVIIIGAGPAGLSAAIYLARSGLSPLVFAGSPPGGQLTLTSEVENYPGFESILGAELIERMRNQAKKFGTRIVDENVMRVDFSKKPFKFYLLKIGSMPFFARSVIIATGARTLWLGLESEQRLRGKGVSACATCDGFFFKDKTVAVIGGGDTALEEALTLTKFAKKVYIIHRRDSFRASRIMQEKIGVGHARPVQKNPKIKIIYNAVVEEIIGERQVEGVRLRINQKRSEVGKIRNQKNSDRSDISDLSGLSGIRPSPISSDYSGLSELKLDGVFIAIGHKPDTDLFEGKIALDERGYIITSERLALELANIKYQISNIKLNSKSKDQNGLKIDYLKLIKNFKFQISNYRSSTSVKGVFAAGDCVDHVYRQAATAAGMGVAAALEVEMYLESA